MFYTYPFVWFYPLICALWSPAGKGLTSWLSFVVSSGKFPIGILGQVWYLIVSIPDLCTLSYFYYDVSWSYSFVRYNLWFLTCDIFWPYLFVWFNLMTCMV